ncbi:hypothetical protein L195_g006674 [Trifolium pratense]|uniref:Uncharacterized protein n=1 Tax=Trifolium pratense TaxID=57577 RepID=A0A2K3P483_TRIPR|nr:hypothetical protein L195_g006674 [Trifolium pratense]
MVRGRECGGNGDWDTSCSEGGDMGGGIEIDPQFVQIYEGATRLFVAIVVVVVVRFRGEVSQKVERLVKVVYFAATHNKSRSYENDGLGLDVLVALGYAAKVGVPDSDV